MCSLLSVFAAACGPAAAPPASATPQPPAPAPTARPEPTAISYGVSTPVPELLPVWAAQDQGFDVKNGLKLSIVPTEGGSKGLAILIGGSFQAMDVGLAPVVLANAHGADVRVIDSTANAIPFTIVGGRGVTVDNAAQALKGATIGISTFGSESDVAVSLFLQRVGLTRDRDVTVVQVGGTATRLAGLESGAIAATPLLGPELVKAQAEGFSPLLDLSQNSQWLFESTVVNRSFLDAHRDEALALLRALVEGSYFSRARPEEAKRILSVQLKYTDPALIDSGLQEFLRVAPVDLTPSEAGMREVIRQVKQLPDANVSNEDPTAYVDTSLLEQLRRDGFFDQLQRTYGVH